LWRYFFNARPLHRAWYHRCQAILRQFSRTRKVDDDGDDDSEATLKEIDEPEDEEDEAAREEEDADREMNDEAVLDELDSELEVGDEIPELTWEDINLGRFSIHKESRDVSVWCYRLTFLVFFR